MNREDYLELKLILDEIKTLWVETVEAAEQNRVESMKKAA